MICIIFESLVGEVIVMSDFFVQVLNDVFKSVHLNPSIPEHLNNMGHSSIINCYVVVLRLGVS